MQDTTHGVQAAHDNYAQVENALAGVLAKMSAGLGGK